MLKKSQGHSPFFLSDHSGHIETGRSLRSLGSPGSLNQFSAILAIPANPTIIWKPGLKNVQWGKMKAD